MELKDFVKEVINQIGEAVTDCNGENGNKRLVVNPASDSMQIFNNEVYSVDWKSGSKELTKIVDVKFDIAITASSSKEGSGKLGLAVANFGGGLKKGDSTENRVQFEIPVLLPSAPASQKSLQKKVQ